MAQPILRRIRSVVARLAGPLPTHAPIELTLRAALVEVALLMVVVSAVLACSIDLSHLRVPFGYTGDSLFYSMNAQTIIESGWVQSTDRLGAPFGQDLRDFPVGADNGNYLIMWVLALFTDDAGLLINLFFLGSFYLVATSAWFSTRLLAAGGPLSIVVGLIYAFAYFHFARLGHLMLASYWVVPIGVVLAVYAARGEAFGSGRDRLAVMRSALTVLGCVLVGSFGAYYAVFAAMTIAVACVATSIGYRTIRPLLHGALACGAVGAVLVANLWSSISYGAANGENRVASFRRIEQLDKYGLRIIELIRPIPGSRVDMLSPVFDSLPPWPNEAGLGAALGIVGTASLVAMLIWIAVRLVSSSASGAEPVRGLLAMSTFAWLLIASAGGLYFLVWLSGFQWMRALNRSSILILFLVLVWMALTAKPALGVLRQRRAGGPAVVLALTAVTLVALVDQVPSSRFPQDYAATAKAYWHDQHTFTDLERALPRRAAVLVLPVQRFPGGGPRGESPVYDLLKPYLHTKALRFSFGAVQGRESEWQIDLDGVTGEILVQLATAMGFDAILIDEWGYPDDAARHRAALTDILGDDAARTLDDRWVAFDLMRWQAKNKPPPGLRAKILATPRVNPGDCAPWKAESTEELARMFECPQSGSFFVTTPKPTSQSAARLLIEAPGGDGTVTLRWAGKARAVELTEDKPQSVVLPTGNRKRVEIGFSTTAPQFGSGRKKRAFLRIRPEPAPWSRIGPTSPPGHGGTAATG
jgi:phosphoglycerol transferase